MKFDKDGVIITPDDDAVFERTSIHEDESKTILLSVVKQAIEDYHNYKDKSRRQEHIEIFTTASGFLFDPGYTIEWGEHQLSFDDICGIIGLDKHWVKNKIYHQIELKLESDGVVSPVKPEVINVGNRLQKKIGKRYRS